MRRDKAFFSNCLQVKVIPLLFSVTGLEKMAEEEAECQDTAKSSNAFDLYSWLLKIGTQNCGGLHTGTNLEKMRSQAGRLIRG